MRILSWFFCRCLCILDFLRAEIQIVELLSGEGKTVQAKGSAAKLTIPQGVQGVLLGKVHTNISRFLRHIPRNECVVGPICEYSIHTLLKGPPIPQDVQYQIKIPYILKDVYKVHKERIRVRHGNIYSTDTPLGKIRRKPDSGGADVYYDVGEKYINVRTNHFSAILITAEGVNCCSGTANVLVFGLLKNIPDKEPLATVKVYLSSVLSDLQDFESVSNK